MSKIVVTKKVIIEEVIIPAEYVEDFKLILEFFDSTNEKDAVGLDKLRYQKAVTFARKVLRQMRGEGA